MTLTPDDIDDMTDFGIEIQQVISKYAKRGMSFDVMMTCLRNDVVEPLTAIYNHEILKNMNGDQ